MALSSALTEMTTEPYKVKNIDLAAFGCKDLDLSEIEIPGLKSFREQHGGVATEEFSAPNGRQKRRVLRHSSTLSPSTTTPS